MTDPGFDYDPGGPGVSSEVAVPGVPDRAVLLAHGAGSDRRSPALAAVAARLSAAGIPSARFDYPYRRAGRRTPDRPPVLLAATREAAAELVTRSGLPPERLVLGGRSMGGRYCSMIAGGSEVPSGTSGVSAGDPVAVLGLLLLGYPLHPVGSPERLRTEHFPRLAVPVLFVSGDRDAMAGRKALEAAARSIPGPVSFHFLEGADHGYRVPKSTGRSPAEILAEVAEVSVTWVNSLPAG